MSSEFGTNIKISIFGQSHSNAVGVVIDGLKAGFKINREQLDAFLSRRATGGELTSPRKEKDEIEFVSGLVNDTTCGAPICALIRNGDCHSSDYTQGTARPAHADYPAFIKHNGNNDYRGGGHFSGRLTAPLCIAGGIAIQLLESHGIFVGSHICAIGGEKDDLFDPVNTLREDLTALSLKKYPIINDEKCKKMLAQVEQARADGDSVGGIIEACILGLPVGTGEPLFDGIENKISQAVFAIGAVKGIEFGLGFESANVRGSANNDAFYSTSDGIKTKTNNHGGILGGLASSMPVVFRVAFKPTPSIFLSQNTVDLVTNENVTMSINGRHDPCIVLRAAPCVESAAAIAVLDLLR